MNPFARHVIGYHGCAKSFADKILAGEIPVREWRGSSNSYDWLGHGIYFWEHTPARALRWARENIDDDVPAVIGAVIQLGRCFDLTDESNTENLALAFELIHQEYAAAGKTIPENTGREKKARKRDCLVINYYLNTVAREIDYQTVRCAFAEGPVAFDGSMICQQTHIQVAVRDPDCLVGVFRPTYGV